MDGISDDAGELLKDSPCSLAVFDVLRKMGAMRQREAAELMVGHSNYGRPFVMAILAATPDAQLASGKRRGKQTTSTVTCIRPQLPLLPTPFPSLLYREMRTTQIYVCEQARTATLLTQSTLQLPQLPVTTSPYKMTFNRIALTRLLFLFYKYNQTRYTSDL